MKALLLIAFFLTASCLPGHSQLHLDAGQSYTFQFDSFPAVFDAVSDRGPLGLFALGNTNPTIFQPGNILSLEMFEDVPGGSLIASQVLAPGPAQQVAVLNAWQDLQGAIRLTMVAGSANIDEFTLQVHRDEGRTGLAIYTLRQQFAPVPEPETSALLVIGLTGAWLYRTAQRKTRGN